MKAARRRIVDSDAGRLLPLVDEMVSTSRLLDIPFSLF
jgi:hypothetical protein